MEGGGVSTVPEGWPLIQQVATDDHNIGRLIYVFVRKRISYQRTVYTGTLIPHTHRPMVEVAGESQVHTILS